MYYYTCVFDFFCFIIFSWNKREVWLCLSILLNHFNNVAVSDEQIK